MKLVYVLAALVLIAAGLAVGAGCPALTDLMARGQMDGRL